ncbi:MAG: response regulator [bacterium]
MEKILIIDDDVNTCNAYKALLKTEGYTVSSTHQRNNVFNILRSDNIKVVIIDIAEENGADLLLAKHIKEKFSHVCIFIMRVDSSPATMKNIFDIGIEDCFTKPFLPLLLTNSIKRTISRIHLLDGKNRLEKELMKHKEIVDELESNMVHHPATGLYHSNFFHKCFDHEVKRAKRNEHWLSLLLVACKKETKKADSEEVPPLDVVNIVKSTIRESDILAHYENGFAIILPETSEDGCGPLSKRLKENINPQYPIQFGSSTYPTDSYNAERLIKVACSRIK